jgi:type I restriction enzyme, S subunit
MSANATFAARKTEWQTIRLLDVTRHHSGNSKLIKGKLHGAPGVGLFPAYSASGQDVWRDGFEQEGNAIIVSAVGARCGKCFLAEGKWSAIANTHVVWPDESRVDRKLLWYLLNDEKFWIRSGSAQPFVVVRKTLEKEIPLPSLPEQRRIVAEIEKQFTRLDAGVTALRRVQANLKRYRAAVLKAACEGRLVPTEAELARKEGRTFETGEQLLQRILADRRKNWTGRGKFNEATCPNDSDLPDAPQGWAWATVQQLAAPELNSITDGPFGSNLKSEHYTNEGPRVIRLQNIGDGVFRDEHAHISTAHYGRLSKHRVFHGDIIIAALGESPPRACLIPADFGPAIVKADCIRFKPHTSVLSAYANIALNSEPVKNRAKAIVHGVGRPRLNLGEIKSIALPLPPMSEQKRIVAEVERRLSVIDELETVVTANLARATRLRQSVLQQAFAGSS